MPTERPTKREVLLGLLADGMVLVRLDARRPGVKVPPRHADDPTLALNLSYRFASRDLEVGDDRIHCTLSFGGVPYRCELPLHAIFAVTSHVTGEAFVWPEALPEAQPPIEEVAAAPEPDAAAAARPRARSHLRLIK